MTVKVVERKTERNQGMASGQVLTITASYLIYIDYHLHSSITVIIWELKEILRRVRMRQLILVNIPNIRC
jgi:hypothetical protein